VSSHLIRQDLLPVGVGYAILMIVLAAGLLAARRRVASGRPLTRHTGRRDRGWSAFLWHVVGDALGGYLLLATVVVLYYFLVAKVGSNFLDSEFTGSALLLAIALPIYLAATWLRQRRAASRGDSPENNGNGQPGA
jgi:RsiW-degrading membrane proteinase PrsW (M82 family)